MNEMNIMVGETCHRKTNTAWFQLHETWNNQSHKRREWKWCQPGARVKWPVSLQCFTYSNWTWPSDLWYNSVPILNSTAAAYTKNFAKRVDFMLHVLAIVKINKTKGRQKFWRWWICFITSIVVMVLWCQNSSYAYFKYVQCLIYVNLFSKILRKALKEKTGCQLHLTQRS
jgi:hypothetical protein